MNFAFCIFKYFPFGGLERDFTRIIQACQQNGHDIDVYTMKWEGEKPENLRITLIPSKGLTNHSRCNHFVKRFFSIIKTKNYNAIVGFNRMPKLDIYYAGDICYKDNVHNQHNFLYKLTKRYRVYSKFENAVFSRKSKTHIMYIAENVKGTYVKYYDTQKERFHFLTPGIDKKRIAIKNPKSAREKIRKLYKITEQQKIILFIGSNYKFKGLDRSILALASLPENLRKNSFLWVIGRGNDEHYIPLLKKHSIQNNVNFIGTTNEVPEFMAAADILIHPAYREAAGLVLIEAIIANLPVLTTDTCGFAYHVQNSKAGKVIDSPFQQRALNKSLYEMFDDKNYDEFRENAKKYASQKDLYDRTCAAKIIEQVAKTKLV